MMGGMITRANIEGALEALAKRRPVFHSEADFRAGLAETIADFHPGVGVRCKHRPPSELPQKAIDIWLRDADGSYALELRYKTQKLTCAVGGTRFNLTNQSAQDHGRYDFLSDVGRLENLHKERQIRTGCAILLTNDHLYWNAPHKVDTFDAEFRLHEDRCVSGRMAWDPRARDGTTEGREAALVLRGRYRAHWQDHSAPALDKRGGTFRYLLLDVGAALKGDS